MSSSGLLAHLTKNFAPHPENIATEALGHILAQSQSARQALTSLLSRSGISTVLNYQTQQSEGDERARPDLTGKDEQGRNIVLIEAKFWAGLTDNQPNTYVDMLASQVPSVLCFLAPQQRMASLWPEICNRLFASGHTIKVDNDGDYKSGAISKDRHVVMITWASLLAAMESASGLAGENLSLSDISQLRGLCEQQEAEGFLPIRASEFGPESPKRITGLINVIDQVIDGMGQAGLISLQGLRATPRRLGYRRYFDPLPKIFSGQNLWLEYNMELWTQYEHPVWVGGHREFLRLSANGFEEYEGRTPPLLIRDHPNRVWFRIELPIGMEVDGVVTNISSQIERILSIFQSQKD